MKAKLDFTIDSKVFKDLIEIQDKLPRTAIGLSKAGHADGYDHPAGLALLGVKDGKLDTVVNLAMSGGCWDAPNVNYKDFDKGFRKMIESDRIVTGMALIRHPKWEGDGYWGSISKETHDNDAKIPKHLKYQIHSLRTAFADITSTIWMVLHNNYFRLYRPFKDSEGRVGIKEMTGEKMFDETAKKDKIVKEKYDSDKKRRIKKAKLKEERKRLEEERQRQWAEEEKREQKRELARKKKAQEKSAQINLDIKEAKKSIIDAGSGLSYVLGKDGKYILWQTGKT